MKLYIKHTSSIAFLVCFLCAFPLTLVHASQHPYLSSHGIVFSSGNKHLPVTDFAFDPSGQSLSLKRYYNSQSTETGPFGYGWLTGIGHFSSLSFSNDAIDLIEANGRRVRFQAQTTNTWQNASGAIRIITLADNLYTLSDSSGRIRLFDNTGKVLEEKDRNSLTITYNYAGNQLSSVTNTFGQQLTLTYSNNLISSVATPIGEFQYFYDANNNLTSVQKPDGTTVQYIYDDPQDIHNLTGIIDELEKRVATIGYDDQDRVVSSSKADGQDSYQIEYLADNQRKITDSLGVTTTYQLVLDNGVMRVASYTGPGCSACGADTGTDYIYNSRNQITQSTDAKGNITTYEYDTNGNRIKKTEALGTPQERITTWTYDSTLNKPLTVTRDSISNPGQKSVTTMSYDANGNMLSRTESGFSGSDAISRTITYTYDNYGRVLTIDGPRSDVNDLVVMTYYPNDPSQGLNRGQLHTVTDAMSRTTTYNDYNVYGKPGTIASPEGSVSMTYDFNGRLLTRTSQGITVTNHYDTTGRLTRVDLPQNRSISYNYDTNDRPIKIADSLGNSISYAYDSTGKRTREEIKDPSGALTRFVDYQYEQTGELDKTILADGSFVDLNYDPVGNLVERIDALNKTTGYRYDALNRLTKTIEPGEITTKYTYDANDNLVTVTDAENNTTTFTYDDFGRRLTRTSPDTGVTSYSYDISGNLISSTDANNVTTTYSYDILNRLLSIIYPDSRQDVTYSYDQGENGLGRLTSMQDATGTTTYQYDALGRLISEQREQNNQVFTTEYRYNDNSELTEITYPGGRTITYHRNEVGRVTSITTTYEGVTQTVTDNISHLPFGPTTSMTLGNGLVVSNSYDQLYRLTNTTAGSLYNRDYTYFATGNVETIINNIDQNASQQFIYDDLGRLTTAQGKYGSLNYNYDRIGNRLNKNENGLNTQYSYHQDTNLLARTAGEQTTDYNYDPAGNIVKQGRREFTWSDDNRLLGVADNANLIGQYGYDGRGLRTIRVADNQTIMSVYDQAGNLLMESDDQGNILREYVYLDNQRITLFDYTRNPEFYVDVFRSGSQPLVNATVYAFDEQGNYTNISAQTDEQGRAVFLRDDFGQGPYTFRVDYLSGQFRSSDVVVQRENDVRILIEEEATELTVILAGSPKPDVPVYLFDKAGNYLGLTQTTDSQGMVVFILPEGVEYIFRTDLLGNQYWSGIIPVQDGGSQGAIDTGGGIVSLTVAESAESPIAGLKTYLYSNSDNYLGLSAIGNGQGQVNYLVPDGSYKIRIDYLGYQYWSESLQVTGPLTSSVIIPHQDVTISVAFVDNRFVVKSAKNSKDLKKTNSMDGNSAVPANIKISLFTPNDGELEVTATTNERGAATLHVPEQAYKARADYLDRQYWSEPFVWQDSRIEIEAGTATVTVAGNENILKDVKVSVLSASGALFPLTGITDSHGETMFLLPGGNYLFRADYQANGYWSAETTVLAHQDTPVAIDAGGGAFTMTLLTDTGEPLKRISTSVQTRSGIAIGENGNTDNRGQVSYDLSDGHYMIQIDYLGHDFLTDSFGIPETTELEHAIPHKPVTVSATGDYQGNLRKIKNIPARLFTPDRTDLKTFEKIGKDYLAHFSLPEREYLIRLDYLGQQFWSDPFVQTDLAFIVEEGMVEITLENGGTPLANVPVQVFGADGASLNLSANTSKKGVVRFRLPEGNFKFRADYDGIQYWAAAQVIAHQMIPVSMNTGGGSVSLTVKTDNGQSLADVQCHLFRANGENLNQSARTNAQGTVSFDVTDGAYQIRIDYLGGRIWSDILTVPGTLSDSVIIKQQQVAISVKSDNGFQVQPLAGVRCSLFTADDIATGLFADTDAAGQVHFNVPFNSYKVRVEYLGNQYWSETFDWFDTSIEIAHGDLSLQISELGQAVSGATVYLFDTAGTYLGVNGISDATGHVGFTVPENSYKVRVDLNDSQYWSDVINVIAYQENHQELALDLLASSLTNNPNPQRIDGKGPEYRPQLAMLGDLTGLIGQLFTQVIPAGEPRTFYYISDHLNTAQVLVDEEGTVVWQGDFKPFGGVDITVNDLENRFRFPGQIYDSETGLHYNVHRYYDPEVGRYITADPIGLEGGMNLYGYVGGNPVNAVDPMGLYMPSYSPSLPPLSICPDGYFMKYRVGFYIDSNGCQREKVTKKCVPISELIKPE